MAESHSTVREGAIAGAIGAAIVALWYFVIDVATGRPLHTPNLIARMLFGSGSSDAGEVGTIAVVTVVHFATFMVVGIALTALTHLAARYIEWRLGVLIGLVVATAFFSGLAYALGPATGETFPHWTVLGGSILGVAGMGYYLWRNHPELARALRDVPLGDETDSVPHAPDR